MHGYFHLLHYLCPSQESLLSGRVSLLSLGRGRVRYPSLWPCGPCHGDLCHCSRCGDLCRGEGHRACTPGSCCRLLPVSLSWSHLDPSVSSEGTKQHETVPPKYHGHTLDIPCLGHNLTRWRGLNGNGPHGFIHLNTWFIVVGTFVDRLGAVVLLEEMHHWGQAWRCQRPTLFPLSLLSAS